MTVTPFVQEDRDRRPASSDRSRPSARMRARTLPGVGRGDLALQGGEHQDVHVQPEEVLVRDRLGPGCAGQRASLLHVAAEEGHVEAVPAVDTAADVRDRDDADPGLVEESGRRLANVAEALDRCGRARQRDPEPSPGRLFDHVHDTLPRGVGAPVGAPDRHRLAGDNARDRVAPVHRDRVHDPGHRLGIGTDVRRRDVRVRPDQHLELGGKAAGERLGLARAHRPGIAGDTALRAAEGNVHEGALPGHPHRQRADLVEVGGGVIAEPTLGRPSSHVVLDPIAGEHAHTAVVQPDREANRELAVRRPKRLAHSRIEVKVVGSSVELGERGRQGARSRGTRGGVRGRGCRAGPEPRPRCATPW